MIFVFYGVFGKRREGSKERGFWKMIVRYCLVLNVIWILIERVNDNYIFGFKMWFCILVIFFYFCVVFGIIINVGKLVILVILKGLLFKMI